MSQSAPETYAPNGRIRKVLVVDDSSSLRSSLATLLKQSGYQVVEAHDGNEAEALLLTEMPNLVLTDMIMPNRNGLELLTFIRTRAPSVPVIAMSGGGAIGAKEYLEIARRLGAARTLEKPFSAIELMMALREVTDEGAEK